MSVRTRAVRTGHELQRDSGSRDGRSKQRPYEIAGMRRPRQKQGRKNAGRGLMSVRTRAVRTGHELQRGSGSRDGRSKKRSYEMPIYTDSAKGRDVKMRTKASCQFAQERCERDMSYSATQGVSAGGVHAIGLVFGPGGVKTTKDRQNNQEEKCRRQKQQTV